MTAPYFDTDVPLGQRNFYPFTRESLAAIDARKAERDARRKAADDQQVRVPHFPLSINSNRTSRLTH